MDKEFINKDPYALFRHTTFHYLSYYLHDFFEAHLISHEQVKDDSGFGGSTLQELLYGKDMKFNCYLRLLTVLGEFCKDEEEYMNFIKGFMERAIIEVWLIWEEEPFGWMLEVWEKMQIEKAKYITLKS